MIRPALVIAFLFAGGSAPAFAQAGFYLPTISQNSGQDEFRAADGTTCRTTMDGTKRLELGSFATNGQSNDYGYGLSGYSSPAQRNTGVYGRFSMSLDASPGRIDCNKLYRLEIERRELELEVMKRSLASADRRLDEQMADPAAAPAEPVETIPPVSNSKKPASRPGAKTGEAKPKPKLVAAKPLGSPPP